MIDIPRLLKALGIDARKRGQEWWAPCPSHHEKEASWSIADAPHTEANGSFYCFGCGWAGGPADLVIEVVGLSGFSAAREWIAKHGLETSAPPPLSVTLSVQQSRGLVEFALPLGVYGGPLEKWVTPARRYAISRGITPEQVARWGLMYGAEGPLAGRIVFPAVDERGVLGGYTARTFVGADPRYKNPEHGEGADPSALFGSAMWPPGHEHRDVVVVTEGAIDALACERVGVRYIAALGGSKPHSGQMARLRTFDEVVLLTDADRAGDDVAEQLRLVLARWCRVRRVRLDPGTDAASVPPDVLRERLGLQRHGNREPVSGGP